MCVLVAACVLAFLSTSFVYAYELPEPTFTAWYSSGFEVLIPDDGFSLMAFHGKINEKMQGLEAGTINKEVTKAVGKKWSIGNKTVQLNIGDTIYYWIYVIRDGLGYVRSGEWTVTDLKGIERNNFLPRSVIEHNFTSNVNASQLQHTAANKQTNDRASNKLTASLMVLSIIFNFV